MKVLRYWSCQDQNEGWTGLDQWHIPMSLLQSNPY